MLSFGVGSASHLWEATTFQQPTLWDAEPSPVASDRGRRLDHIWVSHDLADKVTHAEIHRDWRGVDKPSDHVPVSLTI